MAEDNNAMTPEQFGQLVGLNFAQEETEEQTDGLDIFKEGEEQAEEVKEEVSTEEETPQEEVQEVPTHVESDAYKTAQFLLSSGQIPDMEVEMADGTFKLSELKELDQETFKDILQEYNKTKEEELVKDKLDISNLTDTQLKLINIVKDGDFTKAKEIFEKPEQLIEPWQGYDPTNEKHNEEVFIRDLVEKNPKMTEKKALALLEIEKSEGTLDETAQSIVEEYRTAFKNKLKETEEQTRLSKEAQVKADKEYIKTLNGIYKDMDIKDSIALQMSKVAQKDKEGRRAIDSLIEETLSDPTKASELIMFLTNKDIYDKRVSVKVKNETEMSFAKKINIIKPKTTVNEPKPNQSSDGFKEIFGNIKLT